MTQRMQITYTPGAPKPKPTTNIERMAVKAQMTAIEHGEELDWKQAVQRASENYTYVLEMAYRMGVLR